MHLCDTASMNWDDYRHILAIARAGSVTAAAEQLGVARTTVSRRLAAAEDDLGVRLFARTPDGYLATDAGVDLVAIAESIESAVLDGEARAMGRDAALSGSLRVSTLDFLVGGWPDLFGSFAERFPGIDLTVSTSLGRVSLRRREADVVLRLGNQPEPYLVGRRLCELTFVPAVSRSLVDRVGSDAPPSAYPWLTDDPLAPTASSYAWLDSVIPDARVVLRLDGYTGIRAAVRAGIGAHLLWQQDVHADPELMELPLDAPAATQSLWVLTLAELKANSRVRAFMDHAWQSVGTR
ncbi:MAG: LysR family transcriptional regulator [Myxococcales bacterium]|nr:LysR family transcriptional regulator [Myxococcales bacterium]